MSRKCLLDYIYLAEAGYTDFSRCKTNNYYKQTIINTDQKNPITPELAKLVTTNHTEKSIG